MPSLEPTTALQVARVRRKEYSAELAMKGALEAAGIDIGDVLAFEADASKGIVVATAVDGSVTIEQPTRKVARRHTIALPGEFYDLLSITPPDDVDESSAELGRVVVYATDGSGTIALGNAVGPAVEPVEVE